MSKNFGCHCTTIEHLGVNLDGQQILTDVNLSLHCGQLTTVIGPNGAGKSTLVKALIGEIPYTGQIHFQEVDNGKKAPLKIGYVPQQLVFDKNTPSTVYDLFASYVIKKPVSFLKDKKTYQQIKEQLAVFQGTDLIDKCIGDLSGGELQRVLLSIATYPMPNLLIMDEPISGMDHNGMILFYNLIDKIKKEQDVAILLISHDLELAYQYTDEMILLKKTIIDHGTPKKVYGGKAFHDFFGVPEIGRG